VQTARLESDGQFNLGRASEITRDELKFAKFVTRLRLRFTDLFNIMLEKQLLLKGIVTKSEWKEIKSQIHYDFQQDNHFTELKTAEIMRERLGLLSEIDAYVGKYYSVEWVRKNVLQQSEEEIEEVDLQIESQKETGNDGEDNDEFE